MAVELAQAGLLGAQAALEMALAQAGLSGAQAALAMALAQDGLSGAQAALAMALAQASSRFNHPDVETLFAPVETLVVQGARAPRPRPAPCALPIMRSISPARKMRSFLYCTHARGR